MAQRQKNFALPIFDASLSTKTNYLLDRRRHRNRTGEQTPEAFNRKARKGDTKDAKTSMQIKKSREISLRPYAQP